MWFSVPKIIAIGPFLLNLFGNVTRVQFFDSWCSCGCVLSQSLSNGMSSLDNADAKRTRRRTSSSSPSASSLSSAAALTDSSVDDSDKAAEVWHMLIIINSSCIVLSHFLPITFSSVLLIAPKLAQLIYTAYKPQSHSVIWAARLSAHPSVHPPAISHTPDQTWKFTDGF